MEARLDKIDQTLVAIQKDIEYQIKRTDELQEMTTPIYKAYQGIKWGIGSVIILSALLGAIAKLKGFL